MGQMDENLWKGVYLALCSGLSETSQTLDTVSNIATVDDPGVIFTSISVFCQHELYLYETYCHRYMYGICRSYRRGL